MRISVKVQPGAKQESIEQIAPQDLKIKVRARAIEGQANESVRELLAEYFDVPKSAVQLIKGAKAKIKIFEVDTGDT